MSKHTAGPWWTDENGHIVCYPKGMQVGVLSKQLPEGELEANHNLIVAAPELLLAGKHLFVKLAEIYQATGQKMSDCQALRDWLAAIAKAEGRS